MSVAADREGLGDRLDRAAEAPATLADASWVDLLGSDGEALAALCERADAVRRRRAGDAITFVVNRNLDPAAVWDDPARLAALLDEAWALGATEICMQGLPPAVAPPQAPLELLVAVRARLPRVHVHAFRAPELDQAAMRLGLALPEFLARARAAGLGSVPGTAARILDDDVRRELSEGTDIPVTRWVEIIETAHRTGLGSTATMVYGHLETPAQQVAHLRTLEAIQRRTGGFSELILMPIQPAQVPPGLRARVRMADERETRALHAVARLMLAGCIDHLQAPWPKVGVELSRLLLRGGADDMGGVLLDGSIDPGAGPEAGISLAQAELEEIADELGRGLAQRTTLYEQPDAERGAPRDRADRGAAR